MKTIETKVTFNRKQGLFVIPSGRGYSCLGLEVCRNRAGRLAHELGESHTAINSRRYNNPLELYADYQRLVNCAREKNEKTGWRSESELTPELMGLEGCRVEIVHEWKSGNASTVRFQVGKSTGFIPCHLQIARRNCTGGMAVCLGKIKSVTVIR